MADGIGQTLTQKAGPLPVWAWAGLGTAGLAAFMIYNNKKKAAAAAAQQQNSQGMTDSSNLGSVPISDLTQEASPMPIQMGDTFVDVTGGTGGAGGGGGGGGGSTGGGGGGGGAGGGTGGGAGGAGGTPAKPPTVKTPKPPATTKPPTTKPKPPAQAKPLQQVTVCSYPQWCGSLWGIAQHFWGNGQLWTAIYNANKAKIGNNPNLIRPGTILTIPAKP